MQTKSLVRVIRLDFWRAALDTNCFGSSSPFLNCGFITWKRIRSKECKSWNFPDFKSDSSELSGMGMGLFSDVESKILDWKWPLEWRISGFRDLSRTGSSVHVDQRF